MKYNKLIRDRIPEILKRKGKKFKMHVADEAEYKKKLIEKLKEEVNEFAEDPSFEELADVLEVIDAIIDSKNYSRKELKKIKEKKAKYRGKFEKRLILEEVK